VVGEVVIPISALQPAAASTSQQSGRNAETAKINHGVRVPDEEKRADNGTTYQDSWGSGGAQEAAVSKELQWAAADDSEAELITAAKVYREIAATKQQGARRPEVTSGAERPFTAPTASFDARAASSSQSPQEADADELFQIARWADESLARVAADASAGSATVDTVASHRQSELPAAPKKAIMRTHAANLQDVSPGTVLSPRSTGRVCDNGHSIVRVLADCVSSVHTLQSYASRANATGSDFANAAPANELLGAMRQDMKRMHEELVRLRAQVAIGRSQQRRRLRRSGRNVGNAGALASASRVVDSDGDEADPPSPDEVEMGVSGDNSSRRGARDSSVRSRPVQQRTNDYQRTVDASPNAPSAHSVAPYARARAVHSSELGGPSYAALPSSAPSDDGGAGGHFIAYRAPAAVDSTDDSSRPDQSVARDDARRPSDYAQQQQQQRSHYNQEYYQPSSGQNPNPSSFTSIDQSVSPSYTYGATSSVSPVSQSTGEPLLGRKGGPMFGLERNMFSPRGSVNNPVVSATSSSQIGLGDQEQHSRQPANFVHAGVAKMSVGPTVVERSVGIGFLPHVSGGDQQFVSIPTTDAISSAQHRSGYSGSALSSATGFLDASASQGKVWSQDGSSYHDRHPAQGSPRFIGRSDELRAMDGAALHTFTGSVAPSAPAAGMRTAPESSSSLNPNSARGAHSGGALTESISNESGSGGLVAPSPRPVRERQLSGMGAARMPTAVPGGDGSSAVASHYAAGNASADVSKGGPSPTSVSLPHVATPARERALPGSGVARVPSTNQHAVSSGSGTQSSPRPSAESVAAPLSSTVSPFHPSPSPSSSHKDRALSSAGQVRLASPEEAPPALGNTPVDSRSSEDVALMQARARLNRRLHRDDEPLMNASRALQVSVHVPPTVKK